MQLVDALQTVTGHDDGSSLARRGWCLVTAHKRVVEPCEKCQKERLKLETEVADVQSKMAVLQCQTVVFLTKSTPSSTWQKTWP